MLKFWDQLIRDAFSDPTAKGDRLPGEITPPEAGPYARSASEIVSIQQRNSLPFRIVDIDPNQLSLTDYACQLEGKRIADLTGPEFGLVSAGWVVNDSDSTPFWRTIEIPVQATFVKVEYLPPRVNDAIEASFASVVSYPDKSDNPNASGAYQARDFTTKYSGSHAILLNFDNNTGEPHIAKHGDCFKVPFNTCFVTLKVWGPRVRLTFGFNTEVSTSSDDRIIASKLSMAGGAGVLNNQYMHPVPFCIETIDTGNIAFDLQAPDTQEIEELIVNPAKAAGIPNGVFHGWITGMNMNAWIDCQTQTAVNLGLYIVDYPTMTNKRRRLASVPIFYNVTGQYHKDIVLDFNEPIRFTLLNGQALVLILEGSQGVGGDVFLKFSVNGYTYGTLRGSGVTYGDCPFVPSFVLSEQGYPMDLAFEGSPI